MVVSGLYNVHEKSLIEGECKLEKEGKANELFYIIISAMLAKNKTCELWLCFGLLTTELQRVTCEPLASVLNRINALETTKTFLFEVHLIVI